MLDDVSIGALHSALDGLAERQRAVSDDIANVNTPYFRARRVDFEGQTSSRPSPTATTRPPRRVGLPLRRRRRAPPSNNVNLDAETVLGVETQLALRPRPASHR